MEGTVVTTAAGVGGVVETTAGLEVGDDVIVFAVGKYNGI